MEEKIIFRSDEDTRTKLEQIAKETRRNKSEMLRWLIDQEYIRQFKSQNSTYKPQPPTSAA